MAEKSENKYLSVVFHRVLEVVCREKCKFVIVLCHRALEDVCREKEKLLEAGMDPENVISDDDVDDPSCVAGGSSCGIHYEGEECVVRSEDGDVRQDQEIPVRQGRGAA